ncbi:MAG: Hsp20/alpha crystallin family protein [Bacilli bacterium]|nr:Hsp20/alpha crystallin family protein [Bacilli bacterium]
MDLMNRDFDELFDLLPVRKDNRMKCDIYEKDNKYYIEMEVPGFKKEDIDISLKDGNLTVKAEKKMSNEEKDDDKKYLRKERSYMRTERSFNLGNIDEENIDASFENGVLNIVIPKAEENKRTIEIH